MNATASAAQSTNNEADRDLSVNGKYESGEVDSNYGYLSGYKKPRLFVNQVILLKKEVPQLGKRPIVGNLTSDLRDGAEGMFGLPNIWRPSPVVTDPYNELVNQMLNLIKQEREGKFHNFLEGQLSPDNFRQTAFSEKVLQKLSEDQNHPDILVNQGQFGLLHRGRSPHWARQIMVKQDQFGLGTLSVGLMLLRHPERLQHCDDLWIDCSGDELDNPTANERFSLVPYFKFDGGRLCFGARLKDKANSFYGSASGFIPN